MFLKSLEIRGFKSFADKTQLKFKKGVTAVVGPNGSGKSNISDSVRWVLGEQSVKTLRGGKMEDIIFAGTQFRKPVGLAQVSLILDNTDNSLESDYSEIMVTRRIFRSGETEYLINNKKCRLKDINNLFMDTGIGKEGYSLIGQGKIEAILSGKPEERRALLEEAAGIVKFKSRKEEAEKKLSNTESNLIRIRDIIATYEERIGPLKIEREKALKYKELAVSLKEKEVSALVYYINKVEEEIKLLDKDITARENLTREKRQKLDDDKLIVKELEVKIEELNSKNENEKREYYENKEKISQSNNDIAIFRERINNFKDILKQDKLELASLEADLEIVKREKVDSEQELKSKNEDKKQKESDINNTDKNIFNLNKDIKILEYSLDNLKENEFELLRKSSEVKNNLIILNRDIESKKNIEENGSKTITTIEDNIRINVATSEELIKKINQIKEEKQKVEENIEDNKRKIKVLSSTLQQKDNIIRDATKNINTLEGKLTTLQDLEKSYEGYQMSVKRLMERIEKDNIPQGIDTKVLGEIFKVDKKYETAIEIALAGAISNIITKDEVAAKFLINYLKKNNLGRATFLPLNIIKGNRLAVDKSIEKIDGYLGIATDLIEFNPLFKNIMEYSLGRTIIAKDMDSAIEISNVGSHKLRIVTLDGEVISPGGALTGGSIYKKNNLSILGRRREVKEYKLTIEKNKEMCETWKKELRDIKDNIKILEEEVTNKSRSFNEKVIDITKFEGEVNALQNEEVKLKKSLIVSQKELKYNKEKLESLKEQVANKKTILDKFGSNQIENKKSIEEKEKELECKKIELDKVKEKALQLKIEKATLDEFVQGKYSEVKRKEDEHRTKSERINYVKDNLVNKSKNIEKLKIDIENKKVLIEQLRCRSIELEEIFKVDETRKIALKDKLKIKSGLINELVEFIRLDEIEFNKIQIVKARSESERDSFYRKLNEEWNLTFAEALEISIEIESILKIKDEILNLKGKIKSLGTVNLASIVEYEEVCEKYEFMATQEADLNNAKDELFDVIKEMTNTMQQLFKENFKTLNENFDDTFKELFNGGNAELILSEGDELTANIDINVQPPGKKLQNINLMSGGEKVLSAIALLFAILKMKPTPFCILDEIEAALDDANVYRYAEFLKKFSGNIQFIVITHRKGTMEASDIMYGVTMEEKGVSKVISVDLSENS